MPALAVFILQRQLHLRSHVKDKDVKKGLRCGRLRQCPRLGVVVDWRGLILVWEIHLKYGGMPGLEIFILQRQLHLNRVKDQNVMDQNVKDQNVKQI